MEEEEIIPSVITEDFYKAFQGKSATFIKSLREKGSFELAYEFTRLFTVSENLNFNLRGEQAKVRHMIENHVDATGRVEEAVKISQRDRDTIAKLREEIVESWSLMENSKKREVQALEKLEEIREKYNEQQKDIAKLTNRVDNSDLGQLGDHKVTVIQEVDRLTAEIDDLEKRLQVQRAYSDEIQTKLDDSLEKNRELFHEWDSVTNESMANKRRLDVMRIKVSNLEDTCDDLGQKAKSYKDQSEARHRTLKQREEQLAGLRDELEKIRNSNMILAAAKGKLELNIKSMNTEYNDMRHSMEQSKNFMRLKEDENRKLVIENERNLKKIEGFIRKVAETLLIVSRKEHEIQSQRNEITTAEKERDSIRRANDAMKKEKENLRKKTETLIKETEKRDGECWIENKLSSCPLRFFEII
jgi:myosin heavy subunit